MILRYKAEKVSPPHWPELEFTVKPYLSPYWCERAKLAQTFKARDTMIEDRGEEGYRSLMDEARALRDSGKLAEQAEVENEGRTPEEVARDAYDLDYAARKLVVSWNAQDEDGEPIPFNEAAIRELDRPTKDWLDDLVWKAMKSQVPPKELEGN